MLTIPELTQFIHKNQIELYYQPQISLENGRVTGAEALARMVTDDGQIISPDNFIPVAEESGLINDLTQVIFKKYTEDLGIIHDVLNGVSISMNITQADLNSAKFIQTVEDYCHLTHPSQPSISFEVTESSAVNLLKTNQDIYNRLSRLNIHLAMDDFGTGYSNLQSLSHSPFSKLKIDKSFVTDMLMDKKKMIIVKDCLFLAHRLRVDVVAEGFEDQRTLEALVGLGCNIGQGYYFSKPLALSDMIKFTQAWTPNFSPSPLGVLYLAEQDHLEWRKDLITECLNYNPLEDRPEWLYEKFHINPTRCLFGRWYHSDNGFRHLPGYDEITEPHNRLHALGFELINEALKPERSKEVMFLLIREISDQSLVLLSRLHQLESHMIEQHQ